MGQNTGPVGVQQNGGLANASDVSETPCVISVVGTTDMDAIFTDPAASDPVAYAEYTLTSHFVADPHIVQHPIASPGGNANANAGYTQTAGPTWKLVVEWTAWREGDTPDIPSYELVDSNWLLLLPEFSPESVEGTPGGGARFTISGRYTYGAKVSSQVQMGYPVPPYINIGSVDTEADISTQDLQLQIIDAAFTDSSIGANLFQ